MKNNLKSRRCTLFAALSLLMPVAATSADLEEIVVTGLKRESTVMETPSAITALSASDLAAKGSPRSC